MANSDPHTVKAFDEDIEQIRALVAEMGGLTEEAISNAIDALVAGNDVAAAQVVANDRRIDRLAEEVERHCVRLIALRAPMADDLREILAAFKIGILVERMGDCARSIAEQVPKTKTFSHRSPISLLRNMSAEAAAMVHGSLDSFVKQNAVLAQDVCARDDSVDILHDDLFRELLDVMSADPTSITAATCMMLVSQKLERIGDHATAIARVVYYSSTGTHMDDGPRSAMAEAFRA